MKKILLILVFALGASFAGDHSSLKNLKYKTNINESSEDSNCKKDILGFWQTPKNSESGRVSIVEIIKKDGQYFAYNVAFLDSLPGGKDEKNQIYALRDRDVLGAVFIYNLEKDTRDSYIKGRYYDFNNGKIFHLRARLECDILALNISVDNVGMLGRKEIFKSLNLEDIKMYIKDKPAINFSGVEE